MSPRRPSLDRAPNQMDVARAAGVSAQTVSRVLAGHPNVRPDTAHRVHAAIDSLGYRIHAAAASLASGRTRIIGMIVVSNDRYASAALGAGVETAAAANGYTVTTASVSDHASTSAFLQAFDRLERQGAEGVVLNVPVELDSPEMRLRTERTPSTRSQVASLQPDAPLVVDQHVIGRLAVEHLLDLGHRTVWHVGGDEYWIEGRHRREAWEQVLHERGIEPPPLIPGEWTPESG